MTRTRNKKSKIEFRADDFNNMSNIFKKISNSPYEELDITDIHIGQTLIKKDSNQKIIVSEIKKINNNQYAVITDQNDILNIQNLMPDVDAAYMKNQNNMILKTKAGYLMIKPNDNQSITVSIEPLFNQTEPTDFVIFDTNNEIITDICCNQDNIGTFITTLYKNKYICKKYKKKGI